MHQPNGHLRRRAEGRESALLAFELISKAVILFIFNGGFLFLLVTYVGAFLLNIYLCLTVLVHVLTRVLDKSTP